MAAVHGDRLGLAQKLRSRCASSGARNGVVPLTMPVMPGQRDGAKLGIADLDPGRIRPAVQLRVDLQARTGLSTLRFDAGRFPPDAGSLLPGLLAATQTGLPPAGEHGLTRQTPSRSSPSFLSLVPHAAGHTKTTLVLTGLVRSGLA